MVHGLRRIGKARADILGLQIGKIGQHFSLARAPSKHGQYVRHPHARPRHDRATATDFGVYDDALYHTGLLAWITQIGNAGEDEAGAVLQYADCARLRPCLHRTLHDQIRQFGMPRHIGLNERTFGHDRQPTRPHIVERHFHHARRNAATAQFEWSDGVVEGQDIAMAAIGCKGRCAVLGQFIPAGGFIVDHVGHPPDDNRGRHRFQIARTHPI